MADLATDALITFKAKEEERKRLEQEAIKAATEVGVERSQKAIAKARRWAKPILDAKFGEREWHLVNAGENDVKVFVDSRRSKTLTVWKTGAVTGRFQTTTNGGRYSNVQARYDTVTIRDLAHLGALLATERECIDHEMRYAD